MKELFDRCLAAKYIHTAEGGDYAIEVEDGVIYLLFQWSNGAEDWKNNFDFPARPYKRMNDVWYCHRGFLRVWKAMRDEIEAKVAEIIAADPLILGIKCIGYSHGAALALFATEDMTYHYGVTYWVNGYGFGCPRVVWGIVPQAVKQRLARFTAVRNIPDIVTHVPPALFGFRHLNLFKIGKRGKYTPIGAHYPLAYRRELQNFDENKE